LKLRSDFITNSSSAAYVVKNITNTTKTMWDLLTEATDGSWELVDWPHYKDRVGNEPETRPQPKSPSRLLKFREQVAELESFPPHTEVTVIIAWGDGDPIYCPTGLGWRSQSFLILDSWSC